jgi:hypothetical protein
VQRKVVTTNEWVRDERQRKERKAEELADDPFSLDKGLEHQEILAPDSLI